MLADSPHDASLRSRKLSPTTSQKTGRRCHLANTRLQSIALLLLITLCSAFIYIGGWHSPRPQPPPLSIIAALSLEHLENAVDLGQHLLNLSHTFGFADFRRGYDLVALERRVRVFSADASGSLIAAKQTLDKIRIQEPYPVFYASTKTEIASSRIRHVLKRVNRINSDPDIIYRNKWFLMWFEEQVNLAFTHTIPLHLKDLEEFVTLSLEHCEIMEHLGETFTSILPSLMRSLGLVRPWSILSAWAWDRDPIAQEHFRAYNSVDELFNETRTHCELLQVTEASFRKYRESQDLFRPYGYISTMALPNLPSLEESLARASIYLTMLDEIIDKASSEHRRRFDFASAS